MAAAKPLPSNKTPVKAGRPFAAFDIDGTLIRWQMFHAIVHHLGKEGYILRSTHDRIRAARMEWKNRHATNGFKQYENILVEAYKEALQQIDTAAYNTIVDGVFDEYKDQVFTYTRDLLASLKQQNYLLFAISGSQQEIIAKLAAYHGFDAAVGGELVTKDGAFTGAINTPIFDKAAVLRQLIAQHGATTKGSVAVGDSLSDIAMLELAETPIVFNPDQSLFAEASQRHWQVVVERKNMVYTMNYHGQGYVLAATDGRSATLS